MGGGGQRTAEQVVTEVSISVGFWGVDSGLTWGVSSWCLDDSRRLNTALALCSSPG